MNNFSLNEKESSYLNTLIEKLKKYGELDEKETYGFIIRLAVEGSNGISSYSDFLIGKVKIEEKKMK